MTAGLTVFGAPAHLAACRGLDTNLFFHERGATPAAVMAACATCPIATPCREWGLLHEPEGIWGGVSTNSRLGRKLRKGQRRECITVERTLEGHGTTAGYQRHRRRGEEPCPSCKDAKAAATRVDHAGA